VKTKILIVFLSISLISIAGLCEAQELLPANELTLEEAVSIALKHNYDIRMAEKDESSAKMDQGKSIGAYLPKLSVNNTYSKPDQHTVDLAEEAYKANVAAAQQLGRGASQIRPTVFDNNYQFSFIVTQPIFNGGAEIAGIMAATDTKHQANYSLENTQLKTVLNVKQAYYGVLKTDALRKVAEETLNLAQESLKLAQARYEVGEVPRQTVLRFEAQVAQAEGAAIEALNNLELAMIALSNLMGVQLSEKYKISSLPEDISEKTMENLEGPVYQFNEDLSSVNYHPGVMVMNESIELAKDNRFLAISDVLPKINFQFQQEWWNQDKLGKIFDSEPSWTAGISISLPIFDSFSGGFDIASKQQQLTKARLAKDQFVRSFLQQSLSTKLSINAAKKRVLAAQKERVQADENLKIVTSRLELGLASNLDVLDAQLAYNQARSDVINSVSDFFIALANWEYVSEKKTH